MKKETKANKNKIWEIIPRRKGKLQKLLFIDEILSIKSWSLALAFSSRGVVGVKYVNVQNSCQIIGYWIPLTAHAATQTSRDALYGINWSRVWMFVNSKLRLSLTNLWQILLDFSWVQLRKQNNCIAAKWIFMVEKKNLCHSTAEKWRKKNGINENEIFNR